MNKLWALAGLSFAFQSAAFASGIGTLRIQIFPHLGTYDSPQGAEKDATSVSIISEGPCREMLPSGETLRTRDRLDYNAKTFAQTVVVECDQPATLKREAGLTSYPYRGKFEVKLAHLSGEKILRVINHIDMEDYLRGVVPSEMPVAWNLEALKAQAVAARTYAAYETLNARANDPSRDYDMDDTVQYQAYLGLSKADPRADQAVQETNDLVMTYDGKVVKAYFHADSGGYTEDAVHLFGVELPYCVGKKELFSYDQVPGNPWHVEISHTLISTRLAEAGEISKDDLVTSVEVASGETFESGRVKNVDLTLQGGRKIKIPGLKFRLALKLRSTLFSVQDHSESTSFNGRGHGHGVGMSQWGAKILAESLHYDFQEILNFYYTGISICGSKTCL